MTNDGRLDDKPSNPGEPNSGATGDTVTYRTKRWSQDEVNKMPDWRRSEDLVVADYRHRVERAYTLQNRWLLWLAVANAGALTALASKQLEALSKAGNDEAYAAFALIHPSMWFFFFGIIAAAVAALQELFNNMNEAKSLHNSLRIMQNQPGSVSYQPFNFPTLRQWLPEIMSAACFLGGLAYPLIVLAVRYFKAGHFSW